MKALHRMDRYRKEVLQLSTRKHGINVQYLYDTWPQLGSLHWLAQPHKLALKILLDPMWF